MTITVKKLVISAMFIAIGIVLPFLTGQIPEIGQMLLPMHIPVMLCGFICGWPYGLAVGFITPVLRSFMFGQPILFPMAIAMAFELATYGASCGLLYKIFPNKKWAFYPELVIAMILGRVTYVLAMTVISGVSSVEFGALAWIASALPEAVPGLILQIVIIPVLMMVLQESKLTPVK
ncbi:MAG: ECF transporter S component [Ruminococcaceae bacterium]|nr:ECF transporter S component [Oscillospiraceae bacterium]